MPFYEEVEVLDAPDVMPRRDLKEYKEYLDTLKPGTQHYVYVLKGEPVMRKVKALDAKGEDMFVLDETTGKKIALYATITGEDGNTAAGPPAPASKEGVQFVLEDTGRGRAEMSHAAGMIAAGAEEDINVNVKATQMGRGRTGKNPDTGVVEWIKDDTEPEKTRLRVVRSTKRPQSKEGELKKLASLSDRRMKDTQEQLRNATGASASYKKELQDKIKKYQLQSKKANADLEALKQAPAPAPAPAAAS